MTASATRDRRRSESGAERGGARVVLVVAALLAVIPAATGGSGYLLSLATTALVFAAYGIGFNVVFGGTGQLLLCLGALAGVAGYGSAILADDHGWPLLASMPLSIACATLLGSVFCWVAVRRNLDVIFLGIVTLAFSLAFTNLTQGLRDVTGGETGRVVSAGGSLLHDGLGAYYLLAAIVVFFLGVHAWLEGSRAGWAFRALRDDPVAAALAGVDVARYRVLAGAVGSAMVGTTGAVFAHQEAFISPTSFAFAHVDVRVLVLVSFGGIGSLTGPVVGAAVLGVVDELLRPLGQVRLTVYGVVLVALFLGFRRGLVPSLRSVWSSRRWPARITITRRRQ